MPVISLMNFRNSGVWRKSSTSRYESEMSARLFGPPSLLTSPSSPIAYCASKFGKSPSSRVRKVGREEGRNYDVPEGIGFLELSRELVLDGLEARIQYSRARGWPELMAGRIPDGAGNRKLGDRTGWRPRRL